MAEGMVLKHVRKTTIIETRRINNGLDEADLVRESDSANNNAVYLVNRTQRMIDRLARHNVIDSRQYDAATQLRDAWERAGLQIGGAGARSLDRPMGLNEGPLDVVHDETAWRMYANAINQLSRDERRLVIAVVVHDQSPAEWGQRWRCHGETMLGRCLDKLVKYWGL